MVVFGVIGMSFGIIGMTFGIVAFSKQMKLEKHLKESGIVAKDYR